MLFTPILFSLSLSNLLLQPLHAAFIPTDVERVVEKVPHLDSTDIKTQYQESNRRLLLIDYNGVLKSDTSDNPTSAELESSKGLLTKLAADKKNEVWVVSGRRMDHLLESYKDVANLNLAGSLGAVTKRYDHDIKKEIDLDEPTGKVFDNVQEKAEKHELNQYVKQGPASVVFQTAKVPGDKIDKAELVIKSMEEMVKNHPGFSFNKNEKYAAITHVDATKGKFLERLLQENGPKHDLAISFGNSEIDELMHAGVNHLGGMSVVVSKQANQPTYAKAKVDDIQQFYNFFEDILSSTSSMKNNL